MFVLIESIGGVVGRIWLHDSWDGICELARKPFKEGAKRDMTSDEIADFDTTGFISWNDDDDQLAIYSAEN